MLAHCPCGTGKEYSECCGLYIDGDQFAPTPELLMRSRYTAYTRANIDYIGATMRSYALEGFDPITAKQWASSVTWRGLDVLRSTVDLPQGFVEFKATFTEENVNHAIHEMSEFELIDGRWFYIDGIHLS